MNYSVFKLKQQGGKNGIFWEKDAFGFPTVPVLLPPIETVPKNDRKFGYKKREQRFPVRRYASDRHHIETDMVTLTPDEPPPPPKPAKNFIKRNREKISQKKPDSNNTVTLTQEQLNAILRSVGKVAGGSDNAVKISIDKAGGKDEITVESPRRRDDNYSDNNDEDYEDRRARRRSKKKLETKEEEGASIYSLLGNKSVTKASTDHDSDGGSDVSVDSGRDRRPRRTGPRKDTKSRRHDNDDEDSEDDDRDNRRRSKSKKKNDAEDVGRDNKNRRTKSKHRDDDYDDDDSRDNRNRRNRSKRRDDSYDSDSKEVVRRRNRSKRREESDEEELDVRDNERTRKKDKSRKNENSKERYERRIRKSSRSQEREVNGHNSSVNQEPEEVESPRDKIGLPMDLSWRHMTKAERRRLEMARQRLIDEEEKREEDKIKKLNSRYSSGRDEPPSLRKQPPRSDPVTRMTRHERGRDTEISNHTDGYRRVDRRSPSPEESRTLERTPERSPDPPYQHSSPTADSSPKGPIGLPKKHMTLAEKKRLEWERERVESSALQRQGEFDPWGRPGAGAPIRTRSGHVVADYKGRQDQLRASTQKIEEEPSIKSADPHPPAERKTQRRYSPPPEPSALHYQDQQNVPHAMRSSFVFGQGVADEQLKQTKEQERKQWLADLEKQIEEKRLKDQRNVEKKDESTWADKLGQSHRPIPFPDQPKDTVSGVGDPFSIQSTAPAPDTARVSSAPDGVQNEPGTYIRGQNVTLDPVTRKEQEEKRRRYLEHQEAVKAQVEEKERQKKAERERKMKEDMEEERKLQAERDMLQKQFESEQQKVRQKEQLRQNQVNQLKAAMDEAQAKALQEKYQRKMQHLEAGGHDTSKLREHLEGELTSRIEQLNTRRERDIQRAEKQIQLQYWGVPSTVEEEGPATDPIPNIELAKITPRTEYGGPTVVEPSYVPGLDLGSGRPFQPHPPAQEHPTRGTGHDPYTEDRVLTPSRFRHPSKPWSDPDSPRREFGTQTGNLVTETASDPDGEEIAHLLNQREDSDVQIQYRWDRGRRVRVKSVPKEELEKRGRARKSKTPPPEGPPTYREQPSPHQHHHEKRLQKEKEEELRKKRLEKQRRKGPVKPGSRPMWGYKNADNKKVKKQSERDPFYPQKKRESEMRRIKREQKLFAMVEANKDKIPDYYVPPTKSRDQSPFSDYGVDTPREVRLGRRSKSHSPHRYTTSNPDSSVDYLAVHKGDGRSDRFSTRQHHQSRSPGRDRSESPTQTIRTEDTRTTGARHKSPPIPAIKHRGTGNQIYTNEDFRQRQAGKYDDVDPLDIPVQNGDFVPFTRTIDVLDPQRAEEPMPLSREATRIGHGRKAYYESHHPEKFGNRQTVFVDKQRIPPATDLKNPLMNPSLVMDHPTNRQDQILNQLSTLKQSLMQRQRELETFSPTDLEKQHTTIEGY